MAEIIGGAAAGRAEASAAGDVKSEAIRCGFELALLSYMLQRSGGRGR